MSNRPLTDMARPLALVPLMALAGTSWAGRPLTVDDANVADIGGGQLESWYARPANRDRLWTVALGVGVFGWIELGASVERNAAGPETRSALQAKLRFTPPRDDGCNFGAVVGRAHQHREGIDVNYVTSLTTCNVPTGPLHINLGVVRADAGGSTKTWGVAKEFPLGRTVAHVEAFGQQHGKPTWQFGLRREVVKDLQLDATLGRLDAKTVFGVGLRLGF